MRPEFKVVKAGPSVDRTLRNILEFYFHDMAEWFKFDQQSEGNYTESTDDYWTEDIDVYLLYSEGIPIGFSIVGMADEWLPGIGARDMTEFFIVRRHRRTGVGSEFASYIWNLYGSPWLVRVYQPNRPALPFWRRIVAQHSGEKYKEDVVQKHGYDWSYFTFDSRDA